MPESYGTFDRHSEPADSRINMPHLNVDLHSTAREVIEFMGVEIKNHKAAYAAYIVALACAIYGGGSQGADAVVAGLEQKNIDKLGLVYPFSSISETDDHFKWLAEFFHQYASVAAFSSFAGTHIAAIGTLEKKPHQVALLSRWKKCKKGAQMTTSIIAAILTSISGAWQMQLEGAPIPQVSTSFTLNSAMYFNAFNNSLPKIFRETINALKHPSQNKFNIVIGLLNTLWVGCTLQMQVGATASFARVPLGITNAALDQFIGYLGSLGYGVFAAKNGFDICIELSNLASQLPKGFACVCEKRIKRYSRVKNALANGLGSFGMVILILFGLFLLFFCTWTSKIMGSYWMTTGGNTTDLNIGQKETGNILMQSCDWVYGFYQAMNFANAAYAGRRIPGRLVKKMNEMKNRLCQSVPSCLDYSFDDIEAAFRDAR